MDTGHSCAGMERYTIWRITLYEFIRILLIDVGKEPQVFHKFDTIFYVWSTEISEVASSLYDNTINFRALSEPLQLGVTDFAEGDYVYFFNENWTGWVNFLLTKSDSSTWLLEE